jgi:protoporphyrinogen oxidase
MSTAQPTQPSTSGGPGPADTADPGDVVIVGAGPAGLTAAYQLGKAGHTSTVLEADTVVGGISRTAEADGWRFDIGGHRFFTKVKEVEALWHEILDDDEFLLRPRMSRIFYDGKFFDYPLSIPNVLGNLGPVESARCAASYAAARVRPPKDLTTFEGFVASRFGYRLYNTFFKTYTEKVWGVPATELQADFAAQRIKNLSFINAVTNALLPKRNQKDITSLIEEFEYPKYGPGMMWERCTELVKGHGSSVIMASPVTRIERGDDGATAVETTTDEITVTYPADHVVSSMPISALVKAMDPPAPAEVIAAADDLQYRDFLTVALVVPEAQGFPDNWIYVHDPEVRLGRIQNFGSWSPYMVKEGRTCLGLEYFVFEGDDLWESDDDDLIALGTQELIKLGLMSPGQVESGYVVRMPKAYPTYDDRYHRNVDVIRDWLAEAAPNVHPIGRNGMHRYNNQDHSMYTAMLTVENILGASHDIWSVNVEAEYHEEASDTDKPTTGGTGRDAPIIPRSVSQRAARARSRARSRS